MTKLLEGFRRVILELAREPGRPLGDASERYTLIAPLGADDRIDTELWRANRSACRVVREHEGETTVGQIVRTRDGSWRFEYEGDEAAEDESVFRLADEQLRAGEYVSMVRDDGAHPYRISAVTDY